MPYSKSYEYLQGVSKQARRVDLIETLLVSAINSIESAKTFTDLNDFGKTHLLCTKVYKIIEELDRALDKRYKSAFCKKQSLVYKYCLKKLNDAWFEAESEALLELEEIFRGLLENWKDYSKINNTAPVVSAS